MLVLTACSRNDNSSLLIRGKVYDPMQNISVDGVRVILEAQSVQTNIYSSTFQQIAQTQSDVDGHFSLNIAHNKYNTLRIIMTKSGYFTHRSEFSASVFDHQKWYDKIYYLMPSGYIKVHLYNAFPTDTTDKVVFYFSGNIPECLYGCCPTSPITGKGPFYDTMFTCQWYGHTQLLFYRLITKYGNTFIDIDTLFVPAFDTAFYDLPY